MAGVGNIYADEILFAAGLRYDRMSDSLSTQEMRRLYRSVVEILHDAIKYGGSTLADEQYVDLHGKAGEYQDHHKVYDREKQPCYRCRRANISKAKFAGRSTYFCEICQV
jgi:formamidopyrimidine-DNA glycosylase